MVTRTLTHVAIIVLLVDLGTPMGAAERPMFWSEFGGHLLRRAELDGSNIVDVIQGDVPNGVAIDPLARKLYWTDWGAGLVRRANLDGSEVQDLIVTDNHPRAIALDPVGAKMYWDNGFTFPFPYVGWIKRANLDGSEVESLLFYVAAIDGMHDIVIDAAARRMYVSFTSDFPFSGEILRFDIESMSGESLVVGLDAPRCIALDTAAGKMYWAEGAGSAPPSIRRADLDGSSIETLVTTVTNPFGIALDRDAGKVYWADSGDIMRANLDGSGVEIIVNSLAYPRRMFLATDLEPPEIQCRVGNVNADSGAVADTLYFNGTPGGPSRTVVVEEGDLLWAAMLAPPANGSGKYLLHANAGVPDAGSVTTLPFSVGDFCFPLILSQGANPIAIWNGVGWEGRVGSSRYFDGSTIPDPAPAPNVFLQLPQGDATHLPSGAIVTFQGVILDPSSLSPKGASVTNAVTLVIL